MTRVDRYLKQMAFWLPHERRARIVAEIRGALLDRIEAAGAVARRSLTDDEVASELAAFGRPEAVAAGDLDTVPVISSLFAVIYWRVLRIVLATVLAVQIAVIAVHGAIGLPLDGAYATHAIGRLVFGWLIGFTCVTITFILLGRWLRQSRT